MKQIVKEKTTGAEILDNKKDGPNYVDKETVEKAAEKQLTEDKADVNYGIKVPEPDLEPEKPQQKETKACPYAKNGKVIRGKKFQPPKCDCGEGHSMVDLNRYHARFVLPKQVEDMQLDGYRVWAHPTTGKAYTYGTQVMVVIEKSKYHELKERNKLVPAKKLEEQKRAFEDTARKHGAVSYGPGYQEENPRR